jgi:hypothetical protein
MDQLGGQRRQSLELPRRKAVLQDDVLSLYIA